MTDELDAISDEGAFEPSLCKCGAIATHFMYGLESVLMHCGPCLGYRSRAGQLQLKAEFGSSFECTFATGKIVRVDELPNKKPTFDLNDVEL